MTSPLFILYGSATGNAEHIAKDLAATYNNLLENPEAETLFSSVMCCELDNYKKKCQTVWESPPETGQIKHGVLIVVSTTGNGDPPENASRFFRLLKRKTTSNSLFRNCAYAVLGLGDTNYDQFCNVGKVVDKKMAELGGTRIAALVCADEATGLEDSVDPWTASILSKITTACRGMVSSGKTATPLSCAATSRMEEEKEMDRTEKVVAPPTTLSPSETTRLSAVGVTTVLALVEQEDDSQLSLDGTPPPSITLPNLGAPRISSVVLVDGCAENTAIRLRSESVDSGEDDLHYTHAHPFEASVKNARYLTSTAVSGRLAANMESLTRSKKSLYELFGHCERRVLEITLSIPEKGFSYEPGDAIGMVVNNQVEDVEFVLEMLQRHHGLNHNQLVSLDGSDPVTLKHIVRKQMDLTWRPLQLSHRRVLYSLSQEAQGLERTVLEWLSSTAGDILYQKFVVEQRKSVTDIMRDFPSLQKISLRALVAILPALVPRYYSVTSSPKVTKNALTIALAVVDYSTPSLVVRGQEYGCRRIGGLASQYLESLVVPWLASASTTPAVQLPIFPKPTATFRLPASLTIPLVLIGPGTGVAPFLGFLQDRQASANADVTYGSVDLFFGCRSADHDFLYRSELEALQEQGVLTRLHVAFSRQGSQKIYVQHLMEQEAPALCDLLIRQRAVVYICGDGNHMAKEVQATISSILQRELGDEALDYLKEMKKHQRLLLDIWS